MSYAGPVFPLTTVEGGEGLTADGTVTYDFRDWMDGKGLPYYDLPVTDSYTLTNTWRRAGRRSRRQRVETWRERNGKSPDFPLRSRLLCGTI